MERWTIWTERRHWFAYSWRVSIWGQGLPWAIEGNARTRRQAQRRASAALDRMIGER